MTLCESQVMSSCFIHLHCCQKLRQEDPYPRAKSAGGTFSKRCSSSSIFRPLRKCKRHFRVSKSTSCAVGALLLRLRLGVMNLPSIHKLKANIRKLECSSVKAFQTITMLRWNRMPVDISIQQFQRKMEVCTVSLQPRIST